MEYVHPRERKLRDKIDVLLKIADVLYFLKKGEADSSKSKRRITFLKLICKKKFPEDYDSLEKEIDFAKDLIDKYNNKAYDEYIKYLKEKYPEVIKRLESESKSSLLAFFKSN